MKQGLQTKAAQLQTTSASEHVAKSAQRRTGGNAISGAALAESPQLAAQRKMIGAVNASPHNTAQAKQIDGAFGTAVQRKGPKDELQKKTQVDAVQRAKKEELKKGKGK